jgi:hypothetical protein
MLVRAEKATKTVWAYPMRLAGTKGWKGAWIARKWAVMGESLAGRCEKSICWRVDALGLHQ